MMRLMASPATVLPASCGESHYGLCNPFLPFILWAVADEYAPTPYLSWSSCLRPRNTDANHLYRSDSPTFDGAGVVQMTSSFLKGGSTGLRPGLPVDTFLTEYHSRR